MQLFYTCLFKSVILFPCSYSHMMILFISALLRWKQLEENVSLVLSPNLTTYYHLYPPPPLILVFYPLAIVDSCFHNFFAFCWIISLSIQTCYYFYIKYFFSIWLLLPISSFFLSKIQKSQLYLLFVFSCSPLEQGILVKILPRYTKTVVKVIKWPLCY